MLKLCIGFLSAGLWAMPAAPTHTLPGPSTKGAVNKRPFNKGAMPAKKKPSKKAQATHQPTKFDASEYRGVVKSMRVDKAGAIVQIAFKLSGNTRTILIKGCGTKSAGQPLLNWAFTEGRLVSIVTDKSQCFSAMSVSR